MENQIEQIRPDEPLIWLGIMLLFGILARAGFKSGRVEIKYLYDYTRAEKPFHFWALIGAQSFIAIYAGIMYLLLFTYG